MSNFDAEANAAVLEAQIDAAKRAPNFAVFKSGDDDIDNALMNGGMQVASAGSDTRTLYNTETGEPVEVRVAFLAKTLMKRRAGNKPAFSTTPPPGKTYGRGTVKCLLHPEHPDYPKLAAIGLVNKVCGGGDAPGSTAPAGALASEFDLELHMQHKHAREYATIKAYRERLEKEEEREMRRQEIAAMREVAAVAARRGPGRPPKEESD